VRTESALNLSRLGKQERQKQQREQSLSHLRTDSLAVQPLPCKFRLRRNAPPGRVAPSSEWLARGGSGHCTGHCHANPVDTRSHFIVLAARPVLRRTQLPTEEERGFWRGPADGSSLPRRSDRPHRPLQITLRALALAARLESRESELELAASGLEALRVGDVRSLGERSAYPLEFRDTSSAMPAWKAIVSRGARRRSPAPGQRSELFDRRCPVG